MGLDEDMLQIIGVSYIGLTGRASIPLELTAIENHCGRYLSKFSAHRTVHFPPEPAHDDPHALDSDTRQLTPIFTFNCPLCNTLPVPCTCTVDIYLNRSSFLRPHHSCHGKRVAMPLNTKIIGMECH